MTLLLQSVRTVDELTTALGVTDNAVRSHLCILERDGLVHQSGVRRAGRKPAYVYYVTLATEELFPKAYGPVLGLLLDVMGDRMPTDAVESLLREVAARPVPETGATDMDALNIEPHAILPIWNYTIWPRTPAPIALRLRESIV